MVCHHLRRLDLDTSSHSAGLRFIGLLTAIRVLSASPAICAPHAIEFRNEDSSAIEVVQVCIDTSCADYQMECGAGAVCSVQVEIDYGCVDITVATIRSGLISEHTPPRSVCSIGELERYDRNGDGKVTTIDFGPFMEAFHAP